VVFIIFGIVVQNAADIAVFAVFGIAGLLTSTVLPRRS
jgi:hypothetical protein